MNASASPEVTPARLAESVAELAARVDEASVRAQLHALVSLLENIDSGDPDPSERAPLEDRIGAALESDDEAGAIAAMRELAALDRAAVRAVDWSAASSG